MALRVFLSSFLLFALLCDVHAQLETVNVMLLNNSPADLALRQIEKVGGAISVNLVHALESDVCRYDMQTAASTQSTAHKAPS